MHRLADIALALAGVLLFAGAAPVRQQEIGLFASLPILWSESDSLAGLLKVDEQPHWARGVLERHGRVVPLDTLSRLDPAIGLIVMAQPRPLSPGENVTLDRWVRRGGRVLLFADPQLTQHSLFPLGDRRRPETLAMLSPILARWGLELRFDEDQPIGEREIALLGHRLPVEKAGSFALLGRYGRCRLLDDAVAARCRVGRGTVLAVADAALFDPDADDENNRREMLEKLVLEAEKRI